MSIIGSLDQVTPEEVVGWASDTQAPNAPVFVEAVANGKVIASGQASLYREDLRAAGIGNGLHGFRIAIVNNGMEISCRVQGIEIPRAPLAAKTEQKAQKAGEFWDSFVDMRPKMAPRVRWNESPQIVRDHNHRVCGRYVEGGTNRGLIELFKEKAAGSFPFAKAVSIGCGTGAKEMLLIKEGLCSHFDLFDVSAESLKEGKRISEEWGIADKVRFVHGNEFENLLDRNYDLVYWDSALHHMFDARAAVKWSRDVLRPGGWFLMTDFVGANRFQFPDEAIWLADLVRSTLPERFLVNPVDANSPYPGFVRRPTLQEMEYDPSEAADSEAIIPAIEEYFPDAIIKNVGGTVYHLGISDVLTHIPENSDLLEFLLNIDRKTSYIPHYAVALAQVPE